MFRIGPYTPSESLRWLGRFVIGPTRRHRDLHEPLSLPWVSPGPVETRVRLVLAGDLMADQGRRVRFGPGVHDFVAGCDWLVVNLEGVLAAKRDIVLVRQYLSPHVLEDMAALFPPERTAFSLGNNHAGDYGPEECARTEALVRGQGSTVFGLAARPSFRPCPEVAIHGATTLSNRPAAFVSWLRDARPDPEVACNLLFLHWGEEFVAYPGPDQLARGRALLRDWNGVVGHHSHCPGPVSMEERNGPPRLLAHSLGNLSFFLRAPVVRYGMLLRLDLGPDPSGTWQVARLDRVFTEIAAVSRREIRVITRGLCPVL